MIKKENIFLVRIFLVNLGHSSPFMIKLSLDSLLFALHVLLVDLWLKISLLEFDYSHENELFFIYLIIQLIIYKNEKKKNSIFTYFKTKS